MIMKHLHLCCSILIVALFAASNIACAEISDFKNTEKVALNTIAQNNSEKFNQSLSSQTVVDNNKEKETNSAGTPAPESDTYAMILAGLALILLSMRRRNSEN